MISLQAEFCLILSQYYRLCSPVKLAMKVVLKKPGLFQAEQNYESNQLKIKEGRGHLLESIKSTVGEAGRWRSHES